MPLDRDSAVPFTEAIDYLRDRLALTESEWRDLLRSAESRAEEVIDEQAESMRRDLLEAAAEIFGQGGTADDFRARYDGITARYGWATPGSPGWHSNLIWRMETFGARAAGRWEQAWRLQRARPNVRYYFRYVTAGDHRVRDSHRAWHGIILPIGHEFWRTHFPPNGFNCRCHVTIVTERDLVRYGWTETADSDPRLRIAPDDGFDGNVGLAWHELRGEAEPAPPAQRPQAPSGISLERLVAEAENLPASTSVEVGDMPEVMAERMGAQSRKVQLSADTVARHRHHLQVDASAYGAVLVRLLATGQVLVDPAKPNHVRVVGMVDGKLWAAIVKVDAQGQLWLSSLHRTTERQIRRWRKEAGGG